MVKVYVIELSCLIELLRDDQVGAKKDQLIKRAHDLISEIPPVVKNR